MQKKSNHILCVSNPVFSLNNELFEGGRNTVKYPLSLLTAIRTSRVVSKNTVQAIQLSS